MRKQIAAANWKMNCTVQQAEDLLNKLAQAETQLNEQQIAIIYLGTKGLLNKVPVNKVRDFETEYLQVLESKHKDTLDKIAAGKIDDEITGVLEQVSADVAGKYNS